jgi:hypothetical protein
MPPWAVRGGHCDSRLLRAGCFFSLDEVSDSRAERRVEIRVISTSGVRKTVG